MDNKENKNEEQIDDVAEEKVDATDDVKIEKDKTDSKKKEKKEKESKIEKLESKLKEAENKYNELHNKYLMVYAEMENTKKRLKDDAIKDRKYASQNVISELLNPIDMLIQVVNMPVNSPELQNYLYGFQMIANQISDVLVKEGLAPIEADNKDFDPKYMQAVSTEWDETKKEGLVLKVNQKGYMYKDRVLRPAMVVVNKKPEEKQEEKKVEE